MSGPAVTRQIGLLNIQAEQVAQGADGWEEFCGNVVINNVLYASGSLKANLATQTIKGSGTLYASSSIPRLQAQIVFFDGDFEIRADLAQVFKRAGVDHFNVAGLAVEISKMQLVQGGIEVGGKLSLPAVMGGSTLDLDTISVINGEVDVKGEFTLQEFKIPNSNLGLKDVSISFDSKAQEFAGKGTLQFPGNLALTGELGVKKGRLDSIGVGITFSGAPLDGTGVLVDSLMGKVSGLAEPPVKVTAEAGFHVGPEILGHTAVRAAKVTLSIDSSGLLEGSGQLVFLDEFTVASGSFYVKRGGFGLHAEVEIVILTAELDVKVSQDAFSGKAIASIVFLGKEFGGVEAAVDNDGFSATLKAWFYRASVRVGWDGKLAAVGPTVALGAWTHQVPQLALAGMPPASALLPPEFTMPEQKDPAVIQLSWDAGDASFRLIAPTGQIITPDLAESDPYHYEYYYDPAARQALYAIRNPAPGQWRYEVAARDARTYKVELFRIPPRLALTFTSPAADLSASGLVPITWTTNGKAGTRVSLYHATAPGAGGELIAADLDASLGKYMWNPDKVPGGTYYIYGVLDDGEQPKAIGNAPGRILLTNPQGPAAPVGLNARASNGKVQLTWTPNRESDLAGYRVYDLARPDHPVALGTVPAFTWSGLTPGRTYRFAVSAYDRDGLDGPQSAPVDVNLPVPDPPEMTVNWPTAPVVRDRSIALPVEVENGTTASIFLNGALVQDGLKDRFDSRVSLGYGTNTVRVVTRKPNGDETVAEKEITLDPLPPHLSVFDLKPGMVVDTDTLVVKGKVEPGASLTVNGRPLQPAEDGTFSAPVSLKKGENTVEIVARDVAGNETVFHGKVESTADGQSCGSIFPDVRAGLPACTAVEQLYRLKVIGGMPDGTFQPDRTVTRSEFAKMLVLALGDTPDPGASMPFTDTNGHWAVRQGYLQSAMKLKAFGGFPDGTLRPNDPVTRAQVAKIIAAADGLLPGGTSPYTDIHPQDWFAGWVAIAEQADLIGKAAENHVWQEAAFDGNRPATRAEAAMVLANLIGIRGRQS